MPGQASMYRTQVLKLLDGASAMLEVAEERADKRADGRMRPLLPPGFRRKVSALVVDYNKRVAAIRTEEVQ